MDDDYDDCDDDDDNEPIDSCERCGCNVYEDMAHELADGTLLCDQCDWWLAQAGDIS